MLFVRRHYILINTNKRKTKANSLGLFSMSLIFFRYGSRRYLSVFKTKAPSVTPPTKLSNEKYVKVYERAEDVDQKHVTIPVNRDLYPANTPTHTGQVYDQDDYRNVRFVNKAKLVGL
jgi:hypothetical protein